MRQFNSPREALRYHVTGAIERGEAAPIAEVRHYDAHVDAFYEQMRLSRRMQQSRAAIARR